MISISPPSFLLQPKRCIIHWFRFWLIQIHSQLVRFNLGRFVFDNFSLLIRWLIVIEICFWILPWKESWPVCLCLKNSSVCFCIKPWKDWLLMGVEGLRDSVPVPAEGVMLAGGERGEARPDVIFTTLCQSGESPPCKTHVPKIPPTADQACTHPLKLIQHHWQFLFYIRSFTIRVSGSFVRSELLSMFLRWSWKSCVLHKHGCIYWQAGVQSFTGNAKHIASSCVNFNLKTIPEIVHWCADLKYQIHQPNTKHTNPTLHL